MLGLRENPEVSKWLKENKINKTAAGKELKTYQEMQDYFSSPENVSDWGKAYNYTIKISKCI